MRRRHDDVRRHRLNGQMGVDDLVHARDDPPAEYEGYARRVLDDAVAKAAPSGSAGSTAPPVVADLQQGHPAERLLATAQGADLLVVGSRGHGGFVGLLLGSVSQHCITHASCPVVVVPDATEGTRIAQQ